MSLTFLHVFYKFLHNCSRLLSQYFHNIMSNTTCKKLHKIDDAFILKKWDPEENLDTIYLSWAELVSSTITDPRIQQEHLLNNPTCCLYTTLNSLILLKLWALKCGANRKCVNLPSEIQKPFADPMFLVAELHPAIKFDLLCIIYYEVNICIINHFTTNRSV